MITSQNKEDNEVMYNRVLKMLKSNAWCCSSSSPDGTHTPFAYSIMRLGGDDLSLLQCHRFLTHDVLL